IYSHNRQQLLSLQHQYSSLSSKHQTELKKLNAEFEAIKNTRESELSDMQIVIQQARNAERNASSILEQWDRIKIDKESSISKIEDKIILLEDQYRSFEMELKERLYHVQDEIDKKQDLLNDLLNLDELKSEFYSQVDDINRTIKAKEAQLDASEVEIRRRSASLDLIQKNLNDSLISLQEREIALTERAKNLANIVDVNSREQAQVMLSQWIKEKSNEIKALEEKERRAIKAIDDLRRKYGSYIKIP
ncbi:coiled-coil domain-containing protein, partial [Aeromonas jandaei]